MEYSTETASRLLMSILYKIPPNSPIEISDDSYGIPLTETLLVEA